MASSCAVSFSRAHPGEVGSWRPSAPITSFAVSAVDPRKARRRVASMSGIPGIVQTAATTAVIEHDGPIVAMPPWSGDIPNRRGVAPDPQGPSRRGGKLEAKCSDHLLRGVGRRSAEGSEEGCVDVGNSRHRADGGDDSRYRA
ncbi:hypothetical protein Q4I28_000678 [Leishmania naiffi]|uniref:Uncharacterized protein n=1 Tax=Leishmania naiffi TaxID=5678 RepID=A0AAW3C8T0_9TRYP